MQPIFTYLDYRDYLREYYLDRKSTDSHFSYRMLSRSVSMDASYIAKVINKELHLGIKQITPWVKYLKLGASEEEYFRLLVELQKSSSVEKSTVILERLQQLRPLRCVCLEQEQFAILKDWQTPAIRSLLGFFPFCGDYREIANSLLPPDSPKQVKQRITQLQKLGLLREMPDGDLEPTEAHLTMGAQAQKMAVRTFQKQVSFLQQEAIESIAKEDRDISTLTLALDAKALDDIRQILRQCRRQIQARVDEIKSPMRVYQLNLALFPLSQEYKYNDEK